MSEGYWPDVYQNLQFRRDTWYAQSFSPVISHSLKYVKLRIGTAGFTTGALVSIHYSGLDGLPIKDPFGQQYIRKSSGDYSFAPKPQITKFHPTLRVVAGVIYWLIVRSKDDIGNRRSITSYVPSPAAYPRGWLIKSEDAGDSWDWTNLGDLVFAEWGEPPLGLIRYDPSVGHMSILSYRKDHYSTSICVRTETSQPCHLTLWITTIEPRALQRARTVRGLETMHFGNYSFAGAREFEQLQDGDTLYHTFRPTGLKQGTKYYHVFTGTDDWTAAYTGSPIFAQIFPGGPAWETVRRPDAPGFVCNVRMDGNGLPCPDHYQTINESSADDETSQLYLIPLPAAWATDFYHIPDMILPELPIREVHITGRFKSIGNRPREPVARSIIYTHGVIYEDSEIYDLGDTYENKHWHLTANPFTGLPWTYAEVTDLQLGVKLRNATGIGWNARGYCTQLYLKVKHSCCTPQQC